MAAPNGAVSSGKEALLHQESGMMKGKLECHHDRPLLPVDKGVHESIALSDWIFVCPVCGYAEDRDVKRLEAQSSKRWQGLE